MCVTRKCWPGLNKLQVSRWVSEKVREIERRVRAPGLHATNRRCRQGTLTRRSVLKNELRFKDERRSVFAQQLDKFGQPAFLVGAKVVMDVPA